MGVAAVQIQHVGHAKEKGLGRFLAKCLVIVVDGSTGRLNRDEGFFSS
jgi:hypothetical protein